MKKEIYKTYRISEIRLGLLESKEEIPNKIAKKLRLKPRAIQSFEIVRESIDARRKPNVQLVYTVDFSTTKNLNLPLVPDRIYRQPEAKLSKDKKIIIVGFGPCGMFSALLLAQLGYKPLVIERGKDVDQRSKDVDQFWSEGKLNPESNVQFGEGGAGTFSDGKLTTGINDSRIYKVLSEFYRFGGPADIIYKHKAHIGTDLLRQVVKNLRQEIIRLGGQIRFSTKLVDFIIKEDQLQAIEVEKSGVRESIACDKLILAIGHSARDTFRQAYERKLQIGQKAFSIGARIQHPQSLINQAQYGMESHAQILGAAEYKLNTKTSSGRGVYTFCMCPGGEVVQASSAYDQIVSNGMSYHARDGLYANSALLVDVRKSDFASDHPLAGIEFQEKVEQKAYQIHHSYSLLESRVSKFNKSDLGNLLPKFALEAIGEALPHLDKKLRGFGGPEAIFLGPETRSSSPVRFYRGKNFESNIKNIYPGGEGAGYAGGIMSAAVDGLKIAEQIVSQE